MSPAPRLSAPTALLLSPLIHSSTSSRGWALRRTVGMHSTRCTHPAHCSTRTRAVKWRPAHNSYTVTASDLRTSMVLGRICVHKMV